MCDRGSVGWLPRRPVHGSEKMEYAWQGLCCPFLREIESMCEAKSRDKTRSFPEVHTHTSPEVATKVCPTVVDSPMSLANFRSSLKVLIDRIIIVFLLDSVLVLHSAPPPPPLPLPCVHRRISRSERDSYLITGGTDRCIRYWDFQAASRCYLVSLLYARFVCSRS